MFIRILLFTIGMLIPTGCFAQTVDSPMPVNAQNMTISAEVVRQMQSLTQEKISRTSAQRKIDSNLLFTIKMERHERIADGVLTLETGVKVDEKGYIDVEITANVTPILLNELRLIDAEIIVSLPEYRSIVARVPASVIESLAEMNEIIFIMPKREAMLSHVIESPGTFITNVQAFDLASIFRTSPPSQFEARSRRVRDLLSSTLGDDSRPMTGTVTSEGDTTHGANTFRSNTGANGSGVKIGVLSDGVLNVAARQAAGELPANLTVLAGQDGGPAGMSNTGEGTAMLEIIYDIAPGAQLYFATANPSPAQFAQNIRNLRTLGCDIIIDDVSYSDETAFQNGQASNVISNQNRGLIVQAVNEVTMGSQAGALYFSSAGNSGNKNDGTSGVWEGDFVDGGTVSAISGNLHDFGGAVYDTIKATPGEKSPIVLQWSDPLGGSRNDYDLYVLNSARTQILAMSANLQNGTQDPIESVSGAVNVTGNVVVIAKKFSGADRFIHLNTNRGKLDISKSGVVFGHNGGLNTISVGATPASGPFPNLFNSGNKVETFSSDGPRRIFYDADSSSIPPGNLTSTGGQLLQKPDITAADGVTTTTPRFAPFFGTSAASPHAGALAALLKSARPLATNEQIVNAMKASAIDIEGAGTDGNSGAGIFMPNPALAVLEVGGCTSTPITSVQVINGGLSTFDCYDGSKQTRYDRYTFPALAGQRIAISMSSTEFDTYLYLINQNGIVVAENDDGGGGRNSRIPAISGLFSIPTSGTYSILATSFAADATGSYTINLVGGSNCSYSINPNRQIFISSAGIGSFAISTNCFWVANSHDSWLTTNSSGLGDGNVAYSVAANTGDDRTSTIDVGDQTFTVFQSAGNGSGCPFATIVPGQTVNATLTTGCVFTGTSRYVNEYDFTGTVGQQIAIAMNSTVFDSYLFLNGPNNQTIAQNDDGGGGRNSRIPADTGFFRLPTSGTYRIYATSYSADGITGSTGDYSISLSIPAPANNQFANAQVLSGNPTQATGTNAGADKEPGEPIHAGNSGGASVWYRWTSGSTGLATITTVNSDFDTLLAVYTGSSVNGLSEIAANDDVDNGRQSRVQFNAVAGTTYRIAVDGYSGSSPAATGSIVLNVSLTVSTPTFATVGGKVLTPDGRGLRNASVSITDSQGVRRTATTNSFGLYTFNNVSTGSTYLVSVSSKRYRFTSRNLVVNDNVTNVDFVGVE